MNFVEVFNNSFERNIRRNNKQFFNEFYKIFMDKSEIIKDAFKDTDMRRQMNMLETSLMLMVSFSSHKESNKELERLAVLHTNLGLDKNFFDMWMDSLVETLQKVDDQYTESEGLAWRIILSPGLEFMKGFKEQ